MAVSILTVLYMLQLCRESKVFARTISYLYPEGMNYDGAIDNGGCVGYCAVGASTGNCPIQMLRMMYERNVDIFTLAKVLSVISCPSTIQNSFSLLLLGLLPPLSPFSTPPCKQTVILGRSTREQGGYILYWLPDFFAIDYVPLIPTFRYHTFSLGQALVSE